MNFITKAYLPKKRCTLAVGDIEIDGIKIIKPYTIALMPDSMKNHADLSFCYLGEGVSVCAPEAYEYYKKELSPFGVKIIKGSTRVDRHYPFDVAYNIAIVGDKVFCKVSATDSVLLQTCESMGYKIININQGYSKCSVCPIDESSAISADKSFINAARQEGLDVLEITNDNIVLEGFSNGFFGGAGFMEDEKTFSLKGDINTLPQSEEITEFLNKRNITVKNLSGSVADFGSFIPIAE